MKQKQLLKVLKENGAFFLRHGGRHDTWMTKSGQQVQIPRHSEIKETTAKSIIKTAKQ